MAGNSFEPLSHSAFNIIALKWPCRQPAVYNKNGKPTRRTWKLVFPWSSFIHLKSQITEACFLRKFKVRFLTFCSKLNVKNSRHRLAFILNCLLRVCSKALYNEFPPSGPEAYMGPSGSCFKAVRVWRYSFYRPRKDGKLSEFCRKDVT